MSGAARLAITPSFNFVGGYIIHSGAPPGELLLTDPSLLPPQAQLRGFWSPEPGGYHQHRRQQLLGSYQDAEMPSAYASVGPPLAWPHQGSTPSPRKRSAPPAQSPRSQGDEPMLNAHPPFGLLPPLTTTPGL